MNMFFMPKTSISRQPFICICGIRFCFFHKMKPPSILLEKKHWRPSSYATYPNLLFVHVHAGLSIRERPLNFQNGLLLAVQREGLNYLPTFRELQRSVFYIQKTIDVLLPEPTKIVIGCYHPSSRALLART